MMAGFRTLILGAGAAGAAGVAFMTGLPAEHIEQSSLTDLAVETGPTLCLKNNIPFFEDVHAGCYSRAEVMSFMDAQVIDSQHDLITLEMTHPTDFSVATATTHTCREYKEMRWEGWYALSTRDQRREAFFIRACGVLELLLDARPAEVSYFTDGSPKAGEIEALQQAAPFAIVENERLESVVEGDTGNIVMEGANAHEWRLDSGGQSVLLQELANADFDNDGVEEILTFSAVRPADGSAANFAVGLIQKDSPGASLAFTPLDFAP